MRYVGSWSTQHRYVLYFLCIYVFPFYFLHSAVVHYIANTPCLFKFTLFTIIFFIYFTQRKTICIGCVDEMAQYIPQLFPFLLQVIIVNSLFVSLVSSCSFTFLFFRCKCESNQILYCYVFYFIPYSQHVQDPLPEMRSISCWVLSRYCSLFECMNDSDNNTSGGATVASVGSVYYTQTLQVLLSTMFDPMPKVQIAACSALAILIESSFYISTSDNNNNGGSDNIVLPHVHTILCAFARAFDVYGVKASLVLVDTIGTIADTIGKCFVLQYIIYCCFLATRLEIEL